MTVRLRSRSHPLLSVLVLVASAVGGVGLLVGKAAAADSTNYGIRPAEAADQFRMELAPGAATEQTAIVSNRSDKTVTFKVYPADAMTTDQGGFALRGRDEAQTGVGQWAALPFETITLAAGMQKQVPFRITVPAAATPGDYAGGIILEAPPREGTSGEVADQTAVQLNVVERVGVRIYLKVSGTAHADLVTGALESTDENGVIAFTLPITNTGNVILSPTTAAVVRGRVGGTTKLTFGRVDSLLPGQTTTVRATWPDAPKLVWGRVKAEVQYEGGVGRAEADVRRVPLAAAAIVTFSLLLLVGLSAWAMRTVRTARRVLRGQGTFNPDFDVPSRDRHPVTPRPVAVARGRHRQASHSRLGALRRP